jgi:dTDP-4-amino-4,6-dideoxygalactose transaminase
MTSDKASSGSDAPIPFNRSALIGRELEYIFAAMSIGQIAGDQAFTRKCEAQIEKLLGVGRALITTSCTHALEMASLLLNLQPGDEVILPTFTFVSTANAFVLRGVKPIFLDSRPDTLNLDERLLEAKITPRTKAIVPVHYAGVGCEMDSILDIARRHQIPVVEDNAHGLLGKYKGRWLGTFGCLATQSFHETKNFTCGEGGALLVNDPTMVERAEVIREKGTNRSRFFRGLVDKYSWVDVGSSYLMSDVLAAFLLGQIEAWAWVQARRRAIWERYNTALRDWAQSSGVSLPVVPEHCEQAYHMFYMLLPTLEHRQRLMGHLKARNILSVFHYLPLHTSEMGRKLGGETGDCPVAERASDCLLRLPFFNRMTDEEQERVIDGVKSFRLV